MRDLRSVEFHFSPAGMKTHDDPRGERAYLSWKATIVDDDRPDPRKYGQFVELPKGTNVVDHEDLKLFVAEALDIIASFRGMSLDQVRLVQAWQDAGSVGACPVEMPAV